MKRIYTILSCLLLAGMLCIGLYALLDKDATYSESERRKLKTRPKLTFSAMLDGSYASDYRDYFADTFPNREKLMNANRSLNGFYYFSGGSKDAMPQVCHCEEAAGRRGALSAQREEVPLGCNLAGPGWITGQLRRIRKLVREIATGAKRPRNDKFGSLTHSALNSPHFTLLFPHLPKGSHHV